MVVHFAHGCVGVCGHILAHTCNSALTQISILHCISDIHMRFHCAPMLQSSLPNYEHLLFLVFKPILTHVCFGARSPGNGRSNLCCSCSQVTCPEVLEVQGIYADTHIVWTSPYSCRSIWRHCLKHGAFIVSFLFFNDEWSHNICENILLLNAQALLLEWILMSFLNRRLEIDETKTICTRLKK